VLHVTAQDEIEYLGADKDVASVEVTPQHLTLEAPEAYERLRGFAQMNPPIRDHDHRMGVWAGVANGVADVHGLRPCAAHPRGEGPALSGLAVGDAEGADRLPPVMLTHVAEGRLGLERLVDLTSHGANRIFDLADKGRLAVKYHADLTVVDLKARRTITHEAMATRSGRTPFDGIQAKGWPVATIIRGRVVMRDDEIVPGGLGGPVRSARKERPQ